MGHYGCLFIDTTAPHRDCEQTVIVILTRLTNVPTHGEKTVFFMAKNVVLTALRVVKFLRIKLPNNLPSFYKVLTKLRMMYCGGIAKEL